MTATEAERAAYRFAVGDHLRTTRLRANMAQEALGRESVISRKVLQRVEGGDPACGPFQVAGTPLYVGPVADDREWPPLTEEQVKALGAASVAETGWLRLNKPPLDHLLKYFSARGDGHRDLSALLTLLAYAAFSVKEKTNPVEGTVAGSDSYLASLAGMDRKTFSRAADSLCAGWFVTRLDPKTPRGYRIRKPVWLWLTHPSTPARPRDMGHGLDPFAGTQWEAERRGGNPP